MKIINYYDFHIKTKKVNKNEIKKKKTHEKNQPKERRKYRHTK